MQTTRNGSLIKTKNLFICVVNFLRTRCSNQWNTVSTQTRAKFTRDLLLFLLFVDAKAASTTSALSNAIFVSNRNYLFSHNCQVSSCMACLSWSLPGTMWSSDDRILARVIQHGRAHSSVLPKLMRSGPTNRLVSCRSFSASQFIMIR